MARWRRWVFEVRAPLDDFLRHLKTALEAQAVAVEAAEHFDLVASAFGSRAFVKLLWAEGGIEATVKIKSGLFASPAGLERVLLEAGREAQTKLASHKEALP